MRRLVLSLLTLHVAAASPGAAAVLVYNRIDGTAKIDPTLDPRYYGGDQPKIFYYNLLSNGKFFVDPARTSAFPPPSANFFVNTPSEIWDADFSLYGSTAIINLGKLFTVNVTSQAELDANFTYKFYLYAGQGPGEVILPALLVAEPATVALTAVGLLGFAARRRYISGHNACKGPPEDYLGGFKGTQPILFGAEIALVAIGREA